MPRRRAHAAEEEVTQMVIEDACRTEVGGEKFDMVRLTTSRGAVDCQYYAAPGSKRGVICVGGAGGGWDTPVRGWLYPRLCKDLSKVGIACLRVRYRHPALLSECTLDVLAGIHFLESEGVEVVGLVGHSFGGAVVIQAAAHSDTVRAAAPLSTQTAGTEPVSELSPRVSLLFYHGTDDEVLPPSCSKMLYQEADEPKKLVLYPGGRHGLDEAADDLPGMLEEWLRLELTRAWEEISSHKRSRVR